MIWKVNLQILIVLMILSCDSPDDNGRISSCGEAIIHYDLFSKDFPVSNALFDIEQGKRCSNRLNKPILLLFGTWTGANFQNMAKKVLQDEKVWQYINEKFVLVCLYIDERSDSFYNEEGYQENLFMQMNVFRSGSQPSYAIVDSSLVYTGDVFYYTLDTEDFMNWLIQGRQKLFDNVKNNKILYDFGDDCFIDSMRRRKM